MRSKWHFNPRTREGCDRGGYFMIYLYSDFNPRTREGCDNDDTLDSQEKGISIHAPVKDATGRFSSVRTYSGISIHAPVKDATF